MWYLIVSIPDLCTLTYFTEAQQALSGQALKAIFMLNKYVRKFVNLKPKHILDLFDKLSRPTLTYSAEVWGLTTSMITERLHLQFSKKQLGINRPLAGYGLPPPGGIL